jgi:hypothetical protein
VVILFREWARAKNDRDGCMVSLEDLNLLTQKHPNPGFSGLYCFSEEDSSLITESGCSRGFNQYTPGSDFLAIDLDSGDEYLPEVEDILRCREYGYDLWSSGSKGYHIILKHDFIMDKRLPYSHNQFVKELGIQADFSLYQPGRLFRLPRCVHEKTGRRKELLKKEEGRNILIELVDKPAVEFNFNIAEGDYKAALGRLWSLAEEGVQEGSRNVKFWAVAKDLLLSGFDPGAVLSMLSFINDKQLEPLPEEEMVAIVSSAGRL